MERGEATDLFARPRAEGLQGIFGNLEQSVFGEPAYPTIESKAAHLLYFVVKNHPFSDGNKRSGAFLLSIFCIVIDGCLMQKMNLSLTILAWRH
ncbi:Putative DNA-binding protein in cluster with Type I restriction-modification system [uncultured Gammaproteobacteria bacterium]|nr:Putative DNA-binding protein in cluster with Type I restriction-modification system [uncultured Gammaproteobacteria bacterium]